MTDTDSMAKVGADLRKFNAYHDLYEQVCRDVREALGEFNDKDKSLYECVVALRARLAACENATDEMTDSVRYLFVGMEKPGQTFGGIRQHCVWAGMDTSRWPKWMYGRDAAHFNKAARAALVWHIMRHTSLAAQSSAKGVG